MNHTWLAVVSLVGGLGIGAIISAFISKHYEKRKLIFEQKLIKYSNLIDAYKNAVVHKSDHASQQEFVSCQKQVELIGSEDVIALSGMYNGNDKPEDRDKLVKAMREDLEKYFRRVTCR